MFMLLRPLAAANTFDIVEKIIVFHYFFANIANLPLRSWLGFCKCCLGWLRDGALGLLMLDERLSGFSHLSAVLLTAFLTSFLQKPASSTQAFLFE
jgi:hypothetical protein